MLRSQVIIHAQGFGQGQEQSTLKPMVEGIRKNLDEIIFDSDVILTADTGFSSEGNMEYLFKENINAVVPDNPFRKRNPVFADSALYNEHKEKPNNTRKDKSQGEAVIPAKEFTADLENNHCICPAGNEMLYLGNDFKGTRGLYSRYRGKLKDCRDCQLQSRCMKKPVKEQGRQVSFLNTEQQNTRYLDLMKKNIDSEVGRKQYSRRMWTIEPVFGNICSNKRLNRISLRGETKATAQWLLYCLVHNIEKLWKNTAIPQWG